MLGVITAAVRRRRAQAATLFLLAALASAGAAAAPGYLVGSAQTLAVAAAADARGNERLVSATRELTAEPDLGTALAAFTSALRRDLALPGFTRVEDARLGGTLADRAVALAYRQGVCDKLVIDGTCPAAAGEVVVGTALAAAFRLQPGATIRVRAATGRQPREGLALKVVGVYRPVDAAEAYWGPVPPRGTPTPLRIAGDVLFTPLATLAALPGATANGSVDLLSTPEAFRQTDPQLLAQAYERGRRVLSRSGITVESGLRAHADRIWTDQQFIYVGVTVGAVQLLLLCWIALFLAIQLTAAGRRGDLALLKMRGTRRRDAWALIVGQSVLPMLLGGVTGWLAGRYLAALAAGDVTGADLRQQTLYASIAAAAVAVIGGMLAAVLAERRSLGESVVSLHRVIARPRRGWAGNVFDAVVVVLALGGAYEAHRRATAGGQLRGLALIAPVLVALAAGLVAARVVPRLAAAAARPAVGSGRLGIGLTALHLARRPTLPPVFAVLTLVVAVFFGTALSWDVARRATNERAIFETGAHRVLTVQADSPGALLAAVRAADPTGQHAMAAVRSPGVLAVDTPGLAVAGWNRAYGLPRWALVVAALHPPAAEPYLIRGAELSLDATWRPRGSISPVRITVRLETALGAARTIAFGPLTAGRHRYSVAAPGCGEAAPCRLTGLALTSQQEKGEVRLGASVVLHALSPAVDLPAFADRTRWRAGIATNAQVPTLAGGADGLVVGVGAQTLAGLSTLNAPVYPYDAPSPLPVVTAGRDVLGGSVGDPRLSPFPASGPVPVRVVGTAAAIPRLGDAGVLVDLEYALRDADLVGGGVMEVWLAPDAPAGLIGALGERGVRVVDDDSVAARQRTLARQGPAVALRFTLLVALVGVALGVGAFAVVATVERGPRGAEFAALRRQGLPARVVRTASYGGYLAFVAIATALGIVSAVTWRAVGGDAAPVFGDEWAELPVPSAGSAALAIAGLALFGLLVLAATAAGAALVKKS